jgi:6-phosphogluconolactonase/glucosamine-6-phosphate isomerase/deaminase
VLASERIRTRTYEEVLANFQTEFALALFQLFLHTRQRLGPEDRISLTPPRLASAPRSQLFVEGPHKRGEPAEEIDHAFDDGS